MIKDIPELIDEVVQELRGFTDIAVLGLSGGADSTLVALLCKIALGRENVYGVTMPSNHTYDLELEKKCNDFAKSIGIHVLSSPIVKTLSGLTSTALLSLGSDSSPMDSLCYGNIKARLRMTTLYTICELISKHKKLRCRVIGTGNLSEDFIGYATKYGDLGVDIHPIGDLFKSEVYQLLGWFKDRTYIIDNLNGRWCVKWNYDKDDGIIQEEFIDRVPSAHLWENQTDEEELGMTYDEMEPVIRQSLSGITGKLAPKEIIEETMALHLRNRHKIEAVPVIQLRKFFCD